MAAFIQTRVLDGSKQGDVREGPEAQPQASREHMRIMIRHCVLNGVCHRGPVGGDRHSPV